MNTSISILKEIIDEIKHPEPFEEEFEFEIFEHEKTEASDSKPSEDRNTSNNLSSLTKDDENIKSNKRGSGAYSCTPNTASNSSGGDGSNKKIGTLKSKLTTSSRVYKATTNRLDNKLSNDNLRNIPNQNFGNFPQNMLNQNMQGFPLQND